MEKLDMCPWDIDVPNCCHTYGPLETVLKVVHKSNHEMSTVILNIIYETACMKILRPGHFHQVNSAAGHSKLSLFPFYIMVNNPVKFHD